MISQVRSRFPYPFSVSISFYFSLFHSALGHRGKYKIPSVSIALTVFAVTGSMKRNGCVPTRDGYESRFLKSIRFRTEIFFKLTIPKIQRCIRPRIVTEWFKYFIEPQRNLKKVKMFKLRNENFCGVHLIDLGKLRTKTYSDSTITDIRFKIIFICILYDNA